ncbi:MAG: hypothetical protein J7647_14540 [Cyanobacteria bacterium SBLK]|nr:hypothetical protein [Cyanobacteria bacterium SBLK]
MYRTFLSHTHPDYEVYLAIGTKIYEKFFKQVAIELIPNKFQVLLLIVDLDKEEISKWTS